jgi:hypothetical protein
MLLLSLDFICELATFEENFTQLRAARTFTYFCCPAMSPTVTVDMK